MKDTSFSKSSDYREISDRDLYYDLEFIVAKPEISDKNSTSSVLLYIFFTSLIMMVFFGIPQTLTLVCLIMYGFIQQFFQRIFGLKQKLLGLAIIFIANVIDHIILGYVVNPGIITNEVFTLMVWIMEVIWIIFLGVEFLSLFTPETSSISHNTIKPGTEDSQNSFNGLKERVSGTQYELTDFQEEIDTTLLQETFRDIVRYLIFGFIVIVMLDILLWDVMAIISGGNNINEAYFVSGLSLIIYSLIIFSSTNLFPKENNVDKTK